MKCLLATLLVLTLIDHVVVAQKNCYVCAYIEGQGTGTDTCTDDNFDPKATTTVSVPCPDNNCVTYKIDENGVKSTVRSCDAGNTYCANGSGDGPAGVGTVECCNENLCNGPNGGGGGGGGGGGAAGIVMDFSVIVTTTIVTLLTVSRL